MKREEGIRWLIWSGHRSSRHTMSCCPWRLRTKRPFMDLATETACIKKKEKTGVIVREAWVQEIYWKRQPLKKGFLGRRSLPGHVKRVRATGHQRLRLHLTERSVSVSGRREAHTSIGELSATSEEAFRHRDSPAGIERKGVLQCELIWNGHSFSSGSWELGQPIKEEVILRLWLLVLVFCSDMMILKCVCLQCGWRKIPVNTRAHSAPTALCLLAIYLRFDHFSGLLQQRSSCSTSFLHLKPNVLSCA